MKTNLVIRRWDEDKPPVIDIDTHVIVWIEGSWWMCTRDVENEIGTPDYYIEIPPLPDMSGYDSLEELYNDLPTWKES